MPYGPFDGNPQQSWAQAYPEDAARAEQEKAAKRAMMERERQRQLDRSMTPGFDKQFGRYGSLERGFEGRGAQFSDFRGDQVGLGQQLAAEARGQGIGQQVVRQQAQGMADRGMQQQYGMAAGARPGQSAMAYRQAAMQGAGLQGQAANSAAMAGGQMQLGAMGQYGQFLQGARGQDEDTRLRQLGLNDQAQLEALRQRLQLSGMQQQGGQYYNSLQEQQRQFDRGQPSKFDKGMAMFGAAAPIVGGMIAGPPGAAAGAQVGKGAQAGAKKKPAEPVGPIGGWDW